MAVLIEILLQKTKPRTTPRVFPRRREKGCKQEPVANIKEIGVFPILLPPTKVQFIFHLWVNSPKSTSLNRLKSLYHHTQAKLEMRARNLPSFYGLIRPQKGKRNSTKDDEKEKSTQWKKISLKVLKMRFYDAYLTLINEGKFKAWEK